MSIPFSPRATLCTAAVFFGFGALATGNLVGLGLGAGPLARRGEPVAVGPSGAGAAGPGSAARAQPLLSERRGPDCSGSGRTDRGSGYLFLPDCAGRSVSPTNRWAVEQAAGEGGAVRLIARDGQVLDLIPNLMDRRPFLLSWSPAGDWFFVNHELDSGRTRLRVFQVAAASVVERSAIFAGAIEVLTGRYPCLGPLPSATAAGHGWSRDGHRIALVAAGGVGACRGDAPEPLWMIGDAASGRINPASVRQRGHWPMPQEWQDGAF